jgi:hypothetical protein
MVKQGWSEKGLAHDCAAARQPLRFFCWHLRTDFMNPSRVALWTKTRDLVDYFLDI